MLDSEKKEGKRVGQEKENLSRGRGGQKGKIRGGREGRNWRNILHINRARHSCVIVALLEKLLFLLFSEGRAQWTENGLIVTASKKNNLNLVKNSPHQNVSHLLGKMTFHFPSTSCLLLRQFLSPLLWCTELLLVSQDRAQTLLSECLATALSC